ncbi:helix-turn-helix domain-containing protein [Hymenobacter rubripertinctus]|uniref:AraC family transcriptional regulator n=1 Tax=Hymenobacter rubripertinctus TaxID=2029981 RepID=A0A418QXV9_9BACT|nr:helix-turn-helix transcriptional regulator [Hymenobacter rubripertinctus]RIY10007.1 AraC family transcriptional regulator [Hymenobacter rubripertinctus]
MIVDRKAFTYQGNTILEKLLLSAPHRHEAVFQNEGCFVHMKGAGTRLLSAQDRLLIREQESVLLKCGTYFLDFIHKLKGQTVEVLAFHLYPDLLKQLYPTELPALMEKRAATGGSIAIAHDAVIARYLDSLEFYFQNPALVNDELLEVKVKELVLLLVQTGSADSILSLATHLHSPMDINIKNTVDLHTYSNLSTTELAELCNLSLSSFKRAFKKLYHDNPTSYFISQKLKKAKALLTGSALPIGEIAYEAGFNDPLYFARLFRQRAGVAPSTYRASHAHPAPEGAAD